MGTDDIIFYSDVILTAIRRLRVPYLEFLRRLDGLFLIAWILSIFSTILIFLYSATEIIKNIFKSFRGNLKKLLFLILSFITTILPISYEIVQKNAYDFRLLRYICSLFNSSYIFNNCKGEKI